MTGAERIAKERERQITEEKWTPEHDDEHDDGELALVAALFATPELLYKPEFDYVNQFTFRDPWPQAWDERWDKRPVEDMGNELLGNASLPIDERIRQLEKAGALCAAEIDRLLRLKEKS
jgi:hypothetical protein